MKDSHGSRMDPKRFTLLVMASSNLNDCTQLPIRHTVAKALQMYIRTYMFPYSKVFMHTFKAYTLQKHHTKVLLIQTPHPTTNTWQLVLEVGMSALTVFEPKLCSLW
jgi:hypothetical protein